MNTFRTRLRLAVALRVPRPAHLTPLVLFALVGALFLFQLGARDLVSSHEARAAQNAQRMLTSGEFGLPTLFDGQRDLQKPPGFYWLAAAVGALNGGEVSPLAARLPAALAALASVALVYWLLRREGFTTGAVVAAVTMATANHFVAIGRTARIDVPLTFAVAAALVCFLRGLQSGPLAPRAVRRTPNSDARNPPSDTTPVPPLAERADHSEDHEGSTPWFLLSAVAAGCAVLLKGPVGLALIGLTAVAFLVVERVRLPLSVAVLGTAVTAAVAVPWFVWANDATGGEFVRVFFWHHNVSRFTGEAESLATHPWWYYGPRFAYAFLPWTLLLPLVGWAMRAGVWREDRLFRFGVAWAVVMVAVLSAAQFKRADYLLPAFPGAAIALGCAAERWLATRERPRTARLAKWGFGVLTAAAVAVWPVMWFAVEPKEAARQEKRPFAAAIRAHAPKPQPVLLFRVESHLLAYHLGSPLHTLVEWGELRDALSPAGSHTVVMPPEYAADAERVSRRKLVLVADLRDFTTATPPRPLVCLRTAD
jgi:4-amino-4-deoxy-L-arabinose transferase-like glycosyltransferase